jgi:putative MATE family efflux protein
VSVTPVKLIFSFLLSPGGYLLGLFFEVLMTTSFTEGSINKALMMMTLSSVVGMLSMFSVALVDMYFLSLLNDIDVLAGIGFAGAILFITGSLGIGFSVATGVLLSQAVGRGGKEQGGQYFTVIAIVAGAVSLLLTLLLFAIMPNLLQLLGADDGAAKQAMHYMTIVLPTMPLATLAMVFSASLRSVADPMRAMRVSLLGSLINIVLDPLFIFALDLGLAGAAWATVAARVTCFAVAIGLIHYHHRLFVGIDWSAIKGIVSAVFRIAGPALLTNLATPIGGIIAMLYLAPFGSEAVAGNALVGSLAPLLFAVYFSLSGAAGPIIGQNIGAKQPARVFMVLRSGMMIVMSYTVVVWLVLALLAPVIIRLYDVDGLAAEMIATFCYYQVPLSAGLGLLALSNTVFNNCGKPLWSTGFNVVRATLATWLFCSIGATLWGAPGVVVGSSFAMMVFGLLALLTAFYLLSQQSPAVPMQQQ